MCFQARTPFKSNSCCTPYISPLNRNLWRWGLCVILAGAGAGAGAML